MLTVLIQPVSVLGKETSDHCNNSTNNGGNPEDDSSHIDNDGDASGGSVLSDNDDPLDWMVRILLNVI